MSAPRTAMTPAVEARARELAAGGTCRAEAARILGVSRSTLRAWSWRAGVRFQDGRGRANPAWLAASRRSIAVAVAASSAARLLPLNDAEKREYFRRWRKYRRAGFPNPRAAAFAAIGRPDISAAP